MTGDIHYKKLENMYLKANINTDIYKSTTVKIGDGCSEVGLTIYKKYFHALGAIHGSVYFKLLDDSAFWAVNSVVYDCFCLTTSFNIHITKPISTGTITAKGSLKYKSKNIFHASSCLYNDKGEEIAFGSGSFCKSKITLSKSIGYI